MMVVCESIVQVRRILAQCQKSQEKLVEWRRPRGSLMEKKRTGHEGMYESIVQVHSFLSTIDDYNVVCNLDR